MDSHSRGQVLNPAEISGGLASHVILVMGVRSVWWCIHIPPVVGTVMGPAMGECGCRSPPPKDGKLVCTTRQLVRRINESVCTLNHDKRE